MKAPLSWLKSYVDIDVSATELQDKLFSCGFEVEELIETGKDISGVVVGEVSECTPVEGTHLSVCKVDCGDKGIFQICCGANNVKKGIKVPCALVGATVYATAKDHVTIEGVTTIKKGKLRGIESDGMLCSGAELGLNGDLYDGADYNGLLLLPKTAKNGADVKPILGLDDYILDISITANRPDCQSVYGIAREVAAVLNKKIREPDCTYTPKEKVKKDVTVSVLAPELCPRYIAHYVKNIKCAPSPLWLRQRLAKCGIRSVNNIVDITNYVLLELGQPMHAFDLKDVSGRKIIVRRATAGEKITTLDKNKFDLTKENLVICDAEKPVAIAGVMGGLNSEIKDNTAEILFEAAKFARDSVRKTSRALGQHSDSSALFEKGVYEYTTELAMGRALHLIEELKCGAITDLHVDIKTKFSHCEKKKMTVNLKKINELLGIEVPAEKAVKILENLNFEVERKNSVLNLKVPAYREDIDDFPDVAEEIIRFYGYENIQGTFLSSASVTEGGFTLTQREDNRLKDGLAAQGLYEISTYSFYSSKDLDALRFPADAPERKAMRILNPISEDLSIMRTTLAPSMFNVIVRNLRRGNMSGKLFEVGKIYIPDELPLKSFPEEKPVVAFGYWGKHDFFDIKGAVESVANIFNLKFEYLPCEKPFLHPGICAKVICEGVEIGYVGMVSPQITEEFALERFAYIAELDLNEIKKRQKPFRYVPLSKFPEVVRDLALTCDKATTCAEIEKEIYGACKYVTSVQLFDVYAGEQIEIGKKSMAFKITFTPKDEPIEERVDGFVKKILSNLKFKLNITLR